MLFANIGEFQHLEFKYSGCNIVSKILVAQRGKLPLKFTCPADTFTCPATLLNKGELGKAFVMLARLPFSIATCNGANGYVARWYCKHVLEYGLEYIC